MTVEVKICGVKTEEALSAAIEANANYVGFVFFPKSPRHISLALAEELAQKATKKTAGTLKTVALMVNPLDQDVLTIRKIVKPDYIQLHGDESPERVKKIRSLSACPLIKAISVSEPSDVSRAALYKDSIDMILFDAKPPKNMTEALPGGNGLVFDWDLLKNINLNTRFILSGGLNPDNIASAIMKTRAPIVDVSSGVERQPGEKDPQLIKKFITEARKAKKLVYS